MGAVSDIAKAVETAADLAYAIAFLTNEHNRRASSPGAIVFQAGKQAELARSYKADVDRLGSLLDVPATRAKLSLANPYPVELCGQSYNSYAEAVFYTAGFVMRELEATPGPLDRESIPYSLVVHCEKEFERATGKPLPPGDAAPAITQETAKIIKLSAEGLKPRQIAERTGYDAKQIRDARSRYKGLWEHSEAG
jgi:hypothetical protein